MTTARAGSLRTTGRPLACAEDLCMHGTVHLRARSVAGHLAVLPWLATLMLLATAGPASGTDSLDRAPTTVVTDALGRDVAVPGDVAHVIGSGAGCLRLLTYLRALDRVVAVDDMEARRDRFAARPYALANPRLRELPVFGEFRGHDNPELILTLDPRPDVIFKTWGATTGTEPDELQARTGIPVVTVVPGDLLTGRPVLFRTLRLMGRVLGQPQRAEAVVAFFTDTLDDLAARTAGIGDADRPGVYLGGVAFRGPHGLASTEPAYPPFELLGARNLAQDPARGARDLSHADVAPEMILAWDPDVIFLDLATLQLGDRQGGLHELRTDPAYRTLTAVQEGRVHGLLPDNWYAENFGSVLANAYYVGKTLYPARFADVDPPARADAIYRFLVGAPVFDALDAAFGGLAFQRLPVD
jgi:iron complex transport system substrate-binding protein